MPIEAAIRIFFRLLGGLIVLLMKVCSTSTSKVPRPCPWQGPDQWRSTSSPHPKHCCPIDNRHNFRSQTPSDCVSVFLTAWLNAPQWVCFNHLVVFIFRPYCPYHDVSPFPGCLHFLTSTESVTTSAVRDTTEPCVVNLGGRTVSDWLSSFRPCQTRNHSQFPSCI